ncbi:MAG: tetratricopeptide repeat protein [Alphaproteobacteria bacterium]
MLPEEIYVSSSNTSKFKYSHPLNHVPVDDGSMRARLAYDLMTFMGRKDCNYFMSPDTGAGYDPANSDDEVDIMIVDGFYKEADVLLEQRLSENPDDEKAIFQKAFLQHLQSEYEKLLAREDKRLASDPEDVNALINKGFALANLNREEEALRTVDKALRIDPENLTVLSNKAYIAKLLYRDELHNQTLMQAYNASAKQRLEALEQQEAQLLHDMGAKFVELETPSAFDEFNKHSNIGSELLH